MKNVDSRVSRPHVGKAMWKEFTDFIYNKTGQQHTDKTLKPSKQMKTIKNHYKDKKNHWINDQNTQKMLLSDIMHFRNTADQ